MEATAYSQTGCSGWAPAPELFPSGARAAATSPPAFVNKPYPFSNCYQIPFLLNLTHTTPQEAPCPSSFEQAIRTTANPRRREAKSGSDEQPASIRFKAQNLRGGCAWRIAHYLSRKSTSWRSSPAAACTFEPGKRAGSFPCPRSFNRRNCSGPSLPGRSIACRAPAYPSNHHPSAQNPSPNVRIVNSLVRHHCRCLYLARPLATIPAIELVNGTQTPSCQFYVRHASRQTLMPDSHDIINE